MLCFLGLHASILAANLRATAGDRWLRKISQVSAGLLNNSVHHAIFFKRTAILCTVFEGENTVSMLEVLRPISFILASVGVIERAFSMSETLLPVADISVP